MNRFTRRKLARCQGRGLKSGLATRSASDSPIACQK